VRARDGGERAACVANEHRTIHRLHLRDPTELVEQHARRIGPLAQRPGGGRPPRQELPAHFAQERVELGRPDNLYQALEHDGGERGSNWTGRTKSMSLYTSAALHPERTAAAAAVGLGVVLAAVTGARRLAGAGESAPAPSRATARRVDAAP
jgi:hypothetical protein